jgi:NitT/TauT family transport system substrate-binding protein
MHQHPQTRRRIMQRFAGLGLSGAGLALLAGCGRQAPSPGPVAAEPPPETTVLKLDKRPSICVAPQYVAEELLRGEGFTDVRYTVYPGVKEIEPALAAGEIDIGMHFAAPQVLRIEAGDPVVILAGGHVGCFELFGTEQVRAVRELRGKTVAVTEMGSSGHVFVSSMAAHVGLDPRKDIRWAVHPAAEAKQLLAEGRVDAYLGFPPDPQELRAKQIGHVVVSSAVDRPWSGYFCCMVSGNREFVRKNPVATKRALRAMLKATDLCAREPERAAQMLVDRDYTMSYDYALGLMKDLPYGKWREFDPEDTLRYYALRLQEAGMIKSSPKTILERGTDWRFLNELKKELKT